MKFVGCGSAFHTELGNNSAYLKDKNQLFMIDCGSANFGRILKTNLLEGVDHITVLMTHFHPDHIGSLGDLVFYAYFKLEPICTPKVKVITPVSMSKNFMTLMACLGVTRLQYAHVEMTSQYVPENLCGISQIRSIHVTHVQELACYGYLISIKGKQIYYSGDANMIPEEILGLMKNKEIDFIYQDTCSADYEGNVHLSIRKLAEYIPHEHRHIVYCMHLDNQFSVQEAQYLGFQVVSVI